jgi:hypothetical protein
MDRTQAERQRRDMAKLRAAAKQPCAACAEKDREIELLNDLLEEWFQPKAAPSPPEPDAEAGARIRAYGATAGWVMEEIDSLLGKVELSDAASKRMEDALLELVDGLTRAEQSLRANWSRNTGHGPRGTKAP